MSRQRPARWRSLDGTHGGLRPPDGDVRSASPAGQTGQCVIVCSAKTGSNR